MTRLAAYLARIGYSGPCRADVSTLIAVHRAHLIAIPYEAIDVYVQRPVGLDLGVTFDKIVHSGRGGWCFEMNTLLGWALREIGFDVTRLSSTVRPADARHYDDGGHVLLRVRVDGDDWMADAGFGNGLCEPIPWRAGAHTQYFHTYRLEQVDRGRRWLFTNQMHDPGGQFVISMAAADDALLAPSCAGYQADPSSSWRMRLTCLIFAPGGDYYELRGRMFSTITAAGKVTHELADLDAFARALRVTFKLRLEDAEIALLWARACADHVAWRAHKLSS
jgi:N-hydroxyarylamine O-acetyltransferase